jgi:hypothetical protein
MDGQLPLYQSKIRFLNEHLSKVWSTCIWGEDQIVKMLTTYRQTDNGRNVTKNKQDI